MAPSERFLWMNGGLVPEKKALFPAESKGVMYGAGCFETFRSSEGRFFHLDRHLERLNRGLAYLGADRPEQIRREDLSRSIILLLEKNRLMKSEVLVRVQASLGGGRGYSREPENALNLLISTDSVDEPGGTCRLTQVEPAVVPSESRPADLKLSNTLHLMDGWRRARARGFDDALMLTTEGHVAETAVANLFWKGGKVIRTPSEGCDILPGVMRGVVLELLAASGEWVIEQGRFMPAEIMNADLVWITNSVKQIQPVTGIGSTRFPAEAPFYHSLYRDLESYKERHLS